MKEVERVSLGGYPFTFEKDAATLAQKYLHELETYYKKREGGSEILEGIEERMAELLQERRGRDGIVTREDIEHVTKILGKPEDIEAGDEENDGQARNTRYTEPFPHRRLYRDVSNKVVGGVCSGLGAYLNVDPVLFRILFAVFTLIWIFIFGHRHYFLFPFLSTPVVIYIILWIYMPAARTVQERWEQRGEDGTVNSIERNIEKGAKEFEKTVVRVSNSNGFQEFARVLGKIFGILILAVGFGGVLACVLLALGVHMPGDGLFGLGWLYDRGIHELYIHVPEIARIFFHPVTRILTIAVVFIPFFGLLYGGLQLIFGFKSPKWQPGLILFIIWMLCIVALCVFVATGFISHEVLTI